MQPVTESHGVMTPFVWWGPRRPRWYRICSYPSPSIEVPQTPKALKGMHMALSKVWRRLRNFQRWKKATTPMLLNAGTGEVIPFSSDSTPTKGKWVLRRPLTLPESTLPLFLEVPLTSGRTAVKKHAEAPNLPRHQIRLHHQTGTPLPHPSPPQSG